MRLTIETFNLNHVERTLCVEALNLAGTIVDASALLGITRHALKRRIIKHAIDWPPPRVTPASVNAAALAGANQVPAPISAPTTAASTPVSAGG
ncbi:MAG: hypothetical protein H6710_16715 [Myxococcales bacterium]|nr:hypothetical protein [Myxococcales bacterium]MCB9704837.1 hypothetical protein [Myxococcales bacterium]